MKAVSSASLAALLLLALTRPALPQSPATTPTTPPATTPTTPPATTPYSLDAYLKQVEERYHLPPENPAVGLDPKVPSENLLRMIRYVAGGGLPLDIIENAGDARSRFRAQYEDQRNKVAEADAAIARIIGPLKHNGTDILDQDMNDRIATLRQELDRAYLTLQVKQSKERSVEKHIAQITTDIAASTRNDEIINSLQALLQLKTADRDRVQAAFNNKLAPEAALAAAEAEVAQARIALARRRDDIAVNAYGGALSELTKSQIDIALEIDEQTATISALESRLDTLQIAKAAHDQLTALGRRLSMLQDLETVEQIAAAAPPPSK